MPTLATPSLLAERFTLLAEVGQGGYGTIFRAVDRETGAIVALKVLREDKLDLARFEREAALLAKISDPNIVAYIAHGLTPENTPYLAMEWLEGLDLGARLATGPLSVEAALAVALGTAKGLASAHARQIVHRDVKPSNVFLVGGSYDAVKLLDFGIARVEGADAQHLTSTGVLLGTPAYMAPEQARHDGVVSARTDVYGLGALLFHAVTGSAPFKALNPLLIVARLAFGDVPRVREHPDVPEAIAALLDRMLAFDPAERFADARAAAIAIAEVVAHGRLVSELPPASIVSAGRGYARGSVEAARQVERDHGLASATGGTILAGRREAGAATGRCVGRTAELARIEGAFAAVLEEASARVLFVNGARGSGKSRLLAEVTSLLGRAATPPLLLVASGELSRAVVPFGSLRALAETPLEDDDTTSSGSRPIGEARGRAAALAEAFVAAHASIVDPAVYADGQRVAFLDWLAELLAHAPVAIVLDDLEQVDAPSLDVLALALREFAEERLFLLGSVAREAPGRPLAMFEDARPEWLELGPLRPRALLELARAALPSADEATLAELVERSEGNPASLAEILRADEPLGARLSASAAFDARLARLEPGVQQVLRAASVVGRRFGVEQVAVLAGGPERRADVRAALEEACAAELVEGGGDGGYGFVSAALKEHLYASLPPSERSAAHRAFGHFLANRHGAEPSLIAWHFERAEAGAEAVAWYEAAARLAFGASALERGRSLAERALTHASSGAARARLLVLLGEIAFGRGDATEARRLAAEARAVSESGCAAWIMAAGLGITSAGQLGDNAAVRDLTEEVRAFGAADALAERALCLCRAASQLFHAGDRAAARELVREIESAEPEDPRTRAWVARLRSGFFASEGAYERAADACAEGARLFASGKDFRNACQLTMFGGSALIFAGDFEAAELELDAADALARRTGAELLRLWIAYTRAKAWALGGQPARARGELERVRRGLPTQRRIVAGTHVYGAIAALSLEDAAAAELDARAALAVPSVPAVKAAALAALARALVLANRPEEALAAALEARSIADAVALDEHENLVFLAEIEALLATNQRAAAATAARKASVRLAATTRTLSTPRRRAAFLHAHELHAAIGVLSERLGVTTEPPL